MGKPIIDKNKNIPRSSVVIYLPIEIIVREIDAKIYLASKFIKRGYSCVIGSKAGVYKHMLNQKLPFVYFSKGLSRGNIERYRKVAKRGGVTVELQEEGGIYADMEEILNAHQDEVLEHISGICLWGARQQEIILKSRHNVSEDILPITGYPSFDLLHRNRCRYYKELAKVSGTRGMPDRKYIMINTNFAHYNSQLSLFDALKLNRKHAEYLYVGDAEKVYNDYFNYQKELFGYFIEMIKVISEKLPNIQFVVRPHPDEKVDTYQSILGGYANIKINGNGSVREWIVNCRAVIHHDCTSGLESFIMGKPTISYTPIMNDKLTAFLPIRVSKIAKTISQVLELVERAVGDDPEIFNINGDGAVEEIKEIIANLEADSADKIVDFIDMKRTEWFGEIKGILNISGMSRIITYRLKCLLIDILYLTGIRKKTDKIYQYTRRKFPGFSKRDLKMRLDILAGIEGDMPHFAISKILKNTFYVNRKNNKVEK